MQMEKIFENNYLTIELDSEKSIFIYTWTSESENFSIEALFTEANRVLTTALENDVRNVIANDLDFKFCITPDLQTKINETMLAKLNNTKIKKFAHIMSSEFISQLSVEQLFQENVYKTYEDRYFDNLSSALAWINE